MLTPEQRAELIKDSGFTFDGAASRRATLLADKAYAAGAKDMQETIAKKFDGKVWGYDYREIAATIRALETT